MTGRRRGSGRFAGTVRVGEPPAEGHRAAGPPPDEEFLAGLDLPRLMWERSPVGFALLDPRLVLRRFNHRYAELIRRHGPGRSVPVEEGRELTEYFPENAARLRRLADRVLTGETLVYRSVPHEQDGAVTHWDLVLTPLRREQDVIGIVQVAVDATERAAAEFEVRHRDAILEAVRFAAQRFLESAGSWRTHIDEVMARLGRAASVSRVGIFENFTGPDGRACVDQTHEWVTPGVPRRLDGPDPVSLCYADRGLAAVAETLGQGRVVADPVSALPAEARASLRHWGIRSLALVPVFCEDRWWGFIGLDECARERNWSRSELDALRAAASTLGAAVRRQRAEDLLREQQTRYQQVFEATEDGLMIADGDARLVQANPAFHRMHGYRPDELTGRPVDTWLTPDDREGRADYQEPGPAGRRPRRATVHRRRDGSTFPVQVQSSVFPLRGRPHVLTTVRDDTERAQAFELLEQRVGALSRVAAALTVNEPLEDTLTVITRAVVAATPAVASLAMATEPGSGRPRVIAATGLPDGYPDAVRRCLDRLRPGQATLSKEPVVLPDTPRDYLQRPELGPLHPFMRTAGWQRVAVVPLLVRGERLGAVNAYYPPGVRPSPDELAFLRGVADQGAVAVRNARLLVEAQDQAGLAERQRLARELHDSVSQALYGITLGTRTARALVERHSDQLAEPLDYVLSLAEAAMTEMRSLIVELRPESLAADGLVAALRRRVEVLRTRHQITVLARLGREPDVPLPIKDTLYRIAQEALHNAVKHAQAERVGVRLAVRGGAVELRVEDDGVGFRPERPVAGHFGLQTMRERAAALRGSVTVHSAPGRGTRVRVRLPVPD